MRERGGKSVGVAGVGGREVVGVGGATGVRGGHGGLVMVGGEGNE